MARPNRVDIGGLIYHVINRANARAKIFNNQQDYLLFENVLDEAKTREDMNIFAYCIMPTHWHLVVSPKQDGDLSNFMRWLSMTHTQRWHSRKNTAGSGHLYQGRYKSFLCQKNGHFLQLVRYVERNTLSANLVKRAEDWRWSSVWRRERGTIKQKQLLSNWPIDQPSDYLSLLNSPQSLAEEEKINHSLIRGNPFGDTQWATKVINKFNLFSTIRERGRPRKGS